MDGSIVTHDYFSEKRYYFSQHNLFDQHSIYQVSPTTAYVDGQCILVQERTGEELGEVKPKCRISPLGR